MQGGGSHLHLLAGAQWEPPSRVTPGWLWSVRGSSEGPVACQKPLLHMGPQDVRDVGAGSCCLPATRSTTARDSPYQDECVSSLRLRVLPLLL